MTLLRLFGLTLDSDVALPGLLPAAPGASADVVIRRGVLGPDADLVIPEAGSFRVTDGREIIVDALPGVPERNVRLFLLGSAMGLLLHQRGIFPLHANAFVFEGQAVAVAGESGAGKSTLAAWFARRGETLIGDDVIAIRADPGGMVALPGPPRVRLWRQSLDNFGLGSEGLEPSYVDTDFDKWDLPIAPGGLTSEALALRGIYVLEDATDIAITRLGGANAAQALFEHTYRGAYVARVGGASGHLRTVARIASSTPVFRLARPRDLNRLDALGTALLAHVRAEAARTGGAAR